MINYLISIKRKCIQLIKKTTNCCSCFVSFQKKLCIDVLNCFLFEICNENSQVCTKLYARCTQSWIELFATIKLFLFCCCLQKQFVGLNCFRFNKLLHCMFNPINSLVDRNAKMSGVTCHNHFISS